MTDEEISAALLELQKQAADLEQGIFDLREKVDEPDVPGNKPPKFTSPAEVTVVENTTEVVTLTANDPEDKPVTFSITGGPDRNLFVLRGDDLEFEKAPDYEAPGDDLYLVQVTATDPAGATAVQTIKITVTNDPDDDELPPTEEPPEPLPGDGEKIRIPDGAALTKALSLPIKPLTVLALASGTGKFSGTYTVRASGRSKAEPIFIVGEQSNAGKRTGISGKLNIVGSYVKLTGFDFTGSGSKVQISGKGVRVNRCRFIKSDAAGAILLYGGNFPETEVDRCEFSDFAGAAVSAQVDNIEKCSNIKLHRTLFKNHRPRGTNEAVIQILTDSFRMGNVQVHKCLFDSCLQNNGTGQQEIISVKTGGAALTENTVVNTTGFFCLRETNKTRVHRNWFDTKSYVKVFGDGHRITENLSSNLVVQLNQGDAYATDPTPSQCKSYGKNGKTTIVVKRSGKCGTAHCAVRQAVVENNQGDILLGEDSAGRYGWDQPCTDIVLRTNSKAAKRVGKIGKVIEEGVGRNLTPAKKLTAADVGILV